MNKQRFNEEFGYYFNSYKFKKNEPSKCPECSCCDIRQLDNVFTCYKCEHKFSTTIGIFRDRVFNLPSLLTPIKGGHGLFLPIGLPADGGTCEFASRMCLTNCYALKHLDPPAQNRVETYKAIKNNDADLIALRLLIEVNIKKKHPKLIHFFVSGDCPSVLTSKMLRVMDMIAGWGVSICGFTRNYELWQKSWELIWKNGKLTFTVESLKSIKKLGDGMFALPDYKTGIVHLYSQYHGYRSYGGGCDAVGTWHPYSLKESLVKGGCSECKRLSVGCFGASASKSRRNTVR